MGRFQQGKNGLGLSPQLKHLRPQHKSMARSVALGARSPQQLADIYGYYPGQISRIMGSALFQAEVQRLADGMEDATMDIAKDLQLMAGRALENLDEDLSIVPKSHEERKLRNSTSLEILGIVGLSKNGGSHNQTIINQLVVNETQAEKEVSELSERQLREDVMELIEGPEGQYA